MKDERSKETVWYPHSIELAEDIFNLSGGGILNVKMGSGMLVGPGPLLREKPEIFIGRFEQESNLPYKELAGIIQEVLANPKKLLDDCYKLYITEL